MHEENEFLMLDGVLLSITSHKEREREREREGDAYQRRIEKFAYAGSVLRSLAGLEMCKKF